MQFNLSTDFNGQGNNGYPFQSNNMQLPSSTVFRPGVFAVAQNPGELMDDSPNSTPKKLRKTEEDESDTRRDSHNTAEKRRRDKINEKIDELSVLISNNPNKSNKAAILGSAVEHISALDSRYQELLERNRLLKIENTQLKQAHAKFVNSIQFPDGSGLGQDNSQPVDHEMYLQFHQMQHNSEPQMSDVQQLHEAHGQDGTHGQTQEGQDGTHGSFNYPHSGFPHPNYPHGGFPTFGAFPPPNFPHGAFPPPNFAQFPQFQHPQQQQQFHLVQQQIYQQQLFEQQQLMQMQQHGQQQGEPGEGEMNQQQYQQYQQGVKGEKGEQEEQSVQHQDIHNQDEPETNQQQYQQYHQGEIHQGEIHQGEIHQGEIHQGEIHHQGETLKQQELIDKSLETTQQNSLYVTNEPQEATTLQTKLEQT